MNKKVKTIVIVVVSLIIVALLMHLAMNYLVPFIVKMHSGYAAY